MRMRLITISIVLLLTGNLFAQSSKVIAGPMLGYNTMKEVAIWAQLDEEAEISIKYWPAADNKDHTITKTVLTSDLKDNAAVVVVRNLEPGTTYTYRILVDGKSQSADFTFTTQELWHYRYAPPEFSFVAGSCMYTNEERYDRKGKPYGQGNVIFDAIVKEEADFMLWLGDNVYLREADLNSRTGIYHRYSHTRQVPQLKELMTKMHHYAVWDDHDYGPNDSDWTYHNKDIAREAFTDFWANPNYGVGGTEGITGTFWWNDCQFFLLDNRWYRSPQDSTGTILGEQQTKWLVDALRTSRANFKFVAVGGQFISDNASFENHAVFAQEREKLLEQLDKYNIENVVFLNGDRHASEFSKYTTADGDVFYEITSSPLSSRPYAKSEEDNSHRVGEKIGELNYAVITVTGDSYSDRKLSFQYKDVNGKVLATYPIEFPER